ncbi:MAG TPA: enhanced serine sensitivity protein SseB C-terminal domain-containing protein [Opitutales bacterium]|nr:enhanced serine sensitivity protein SseB C-terminal domain-containing protein [Opitutales bacterium]
MVPALAAPPPFGALPPVAYTELHPWHRDLFTLLLSADFPGQPEIKKHLEAATFQTVDRNQSLQINPKLRLPVSSPRRSPVQAHAVDGNGVRIEAMLFVKKDGPYLLQIMRASNDPGQTLPPVKEFKLHVPQDDPEDALVLAVRNQPIRPDPLEQYQPQVKPPPPPPPTVLPAPRPLERWGSGTVLGKAKILGPADGPGERKLMEAYLPLFQLNPSVLAAYLARVQFTVEEQPSLALFLRTTLNPEKQRQLEGELLRIYAPLFPTGEFLDIIRLDDPLENALVLKCQRFYTQPDSSWQNPPKPRLES